jgi:hypothetical protein
MLACSLCPATRGHGRGESLLVEGTWEQSAAATSLFDRSKWSIYCGRMLFTRAVRYGPTPSPSATGHIYCDDPWTATQTAAR